jgi:hypothetical protein
MITRACARLSAVAALRAGIWGDVKVLDSDGSPLAQAVQASPTPYVVVFTDDTDRSEVEGFDLLAADGDMALVIEFGIAAAVPQATGGPVATIPATDAGREIGLDVMEHRIILALAHDTTSTWGEMFRTLATRFVGRVASKRGGSSEGGSRWAARQLLLHVELYPDPPFGVPVRSDHPIRRFLEMAKSGDQDLRNAATLIESALDATALASWRQVQGWLGLTEDAVRGIGLGPPVIPQEIPAVTVGVGSEVAGMVEGERVPDYVGDAEPKDWPPSGIPWPDPLTFPNPI